MSTTELRALWLDDELGGPRQGYVEPWRRWFEAEAPKLGVQVSMQSTLQGFRDHVEKQTQAGQRIDLLIFDLMLKHEPARDFAALDFPREHLLIMDAGAQIARLLLNNEFARQRADLKWLGAVSDAHMILLSSTPTVAESAREMIDPGALDRVTSLTKAMEVRDGKSIAGKVFQVAMASLIDRLRGQGGSDAR